MTKKSFSFTEAKIANLPSASPGKRDMYYDTRCPALAVRVSDTGSKTFLVYKWSDGIPIKRTIGKWPHLTIESARETAAEIAVALNAGNDPLELRKKKREEITLGQLFDFYFDLYAKNRCNTAREIKLDFHRYFGDWLPRRVSTIKKIDVQGRINHLARGGHFHRANRGHDSLRAVFSWGIKQGLFEGQNPCIGISRFKTQSRQRFITPDEFESFMEALRVEKNIKLRDYFYLSLFTGARQANVLSMRWDQIDFSLATWTIPRTKNGESHTVPLTALAIDILQRRHEERGDCPWVFPGYGVKGHLVEPKAAWDRILRVAGIKDLRVHDLRRTLGSYMAMSNQSLQLIGKALGHRSATSTLIYARMTHDPVRNAMEIAQQRMLMVAGLGPKQDDNIVQFRKTKKRKG